MENSLWHLTTYSTHFRVLNTFPGHLHTIDGQGELKRTGTRGVSAIGARKKRENQRRCGQLVLSLASLSLGYPFPPEPQGSPAPFLGLKMDSPNFLLKGPTDLGLFKHIKFLSLFTPCSRPNRLWGCFYQSHFLFNNSSRQNNERGI